MTTTPPHRLLLGLIAAALPLPALAADLVPVTYGTNWVAQPEHGGFYQAVADGTYAACGIDVTILEGGPQVNNRAQLLAGKIDFYMGGAIGVLNAAEQGVPTRMVAALFQKDPQVFMTHPGKAKTFDDLKNLTMFVGDEAYATFYQWLIKEKGFTEAQRKVYTYNAAPFIADENSAMQGYLTSEPLMVEREAGWKPEVFLLADSGYAPYSTTIEAMQSTIDAKPEVVQCFVDGSIKGWYNYLYGDNAKANAAIKAANPDITDELIAFAIKQMKDNGILESGAALEKGIGVIEPERVQAIYDQMVKAGVMKPGLDVTKIYTTQFVGKGVGLDLKPKG